MKKILFLSLLVVSVACKTSEKKSTPDKKQDVQISARDFEEHINEKDIKTHLYELASDAMQGRKTGEEGQKMAAEYIKSFYEANNIDTPLGDADYFQEIPKSFFKNAEVRNDSENVVAFVEGSEKPEEIIVISGHYDHVGTGKDGEIYNGADDDGSGTVAIMHLAKAFQEAKETGNGPKRSILFLHVTGEEIGLYGSKYYTENPIFPLENTVANLNIDMIGRIAPEKEENPEYIYLIGSDKISQELHDTSEKMNSTYTNLELDYTFNADNDPNRFYYRSDHYNFAKNDIPVIFYFSGVHEDYHKPTDTADKIEYDLLVKRAKLVYHTAWQLANQEKRLAKDITK